MHYSALRGLSRVAFVAAVVLSITIATLATTNEGFAGTPLQSKSCNYGGGPNCPSTPVVIGPWYYQPTSSFYPVPPTFFESVADVDAWYASVVEAGPIRLLQRRGRWIYSKCPSRLR